MIDQRQHHELKVQTETDAVDEATYYYHTHDDDAVELEDSVGYNGDYDDELGELSVHTLQHYLAFDNSMDVDSGVDHNSSFAVGDLAAGVSILKHIAIHDKATDCNYVGDS